MRSFYGTAGLLPVAVFVASTAAAALQVAPTRIEPGDLRRVHEAIDWLQAPGSVSAEYDYVMRASVRVLLFWIGRDDVGLGHLRFGESELDPGVQKIALEVGSDPDRAPRGINRWGAAQEIHGLRQVESGAVETSAFFGFMNASEDESREEIEFQFSEQNTDRRYRFQATVNRIEPGSTVVGVLRLVSNTDFSIHQLEEATGAVLDQYRIEDVAIEPRVPAPEDAEDACARPVGFLFAVRLGVAAALSAGADSDIEPICYLYNSRLHTLTLKKNAVVDQLQIDYRLSTGERRSATYHRLRELELEVLNHESGKRTKFKLFVGVDGALRGIPLRIEHQPNWWFKVELDLEIPDEIPDEIPRSANGL